METIKFAEQDIINAICFHIASKKQVEPQQVLVELMWDEDHGFSAEVTVHERTQILVEANFLEAIRYWLQTQLNRDPYAAAVELQLDDEEGIIAFAKYQ
ncbi:YxcD family protein [Brevibacillus migulae]|uniref:YxcD family protein n=1 Tax=Brevibacillus migulae TaxID=1644114 RepID=UPI00106E6C9F|nr:YxcD family protein [Brevibacillus migulae]